MAGRTRDDDSFVLLDGLRGLGAILILIGHTMPLWGPFWAPSGAVIVDAFFLLSGFVIAYSVEPRFAKGMRASDFIIFRFIRIYPLYILGTLLGFAVLCYAAFDDADSNQRFSVLGLQLAPQLFMLPAPEILGGERAYSFNGPAWTLFFEMIVNIAYAVFFRFLTTRVLAVVVALCAVVLTITIFTFGHIDVGSNMQNFWGGLPRAAFGFFGGVLAFRLVGSPRTSERRPTRWAFVLLIGLPLACLMPATPELRPYLDALLVVGLGIPLLCAAQSVAPPMKYASMFHHAARISYALYILQAPLIVMLRRVEWRYPELPGWAPLPGIAVLVVMLLAAHIAERYYDRPVRRWVLRMIGKRPPAKAVRPSTAAAAE